MMSTNKNNLSPEEQALRDKINEADFAYQEADWNAIESKVSGGGWAKYKTLFKTAAAFVVLSGAVYFLNEEMKTDSSSQKVEKVTTIKKEKTDKSEESADAKSNQEQAPTETKEIAGSPTPSIDEKAEEVIVEASQLTQTNLEKAVDQSNEQKEKEVIEEINPAKTEKLEANRSEKNVSELAFDILINGELCLGEEVLLIAKNSHQAINEDEDQYTYRWFINNKRIIQNSAAINYIFDDAGEYSITLKVKDENGSLISSSSKDIIVNEPDEIDFTYEDLSGIFSDFTAQLNPTPSHLDYQWFIEEKQVTLDDNNQYNFYQKGIYSVALVYKDENGCVSKVEKPLKIEEDLGPFQNVINPASETEKNRVFMPHGFEDHKGFFKLTIFDLSGNVVFKSNSPLKKWNGSLNNSGQKLPEGNYVWTISAANEEGQKRNITDRVKLLYLK